jgi:hypothetical protein
METFLLQTAFCCYRLKLNKQTQVDTRTRCNGLKGRLRTFCKNQGAYNERDLPQEKPKKEIGLLCEATLHRFAYSCVVLYTCIPSQTKINQTAMFALIKLTGTATAINLYGNCFWRYSFSMIIKHRGK